MSSLPNLLSYQLVMFDLDGTLVDSVPDLYAAIMQALGELDLPKISEAQCRDYVGNGAARLVQRALYQEIDAPAEHPQFLELLDAFYRAYKQTNGRCAEVYAGVFEVLSRLKAASIKTAIVTNKPYQFARPLLDQLHIDVDMLVGGDSVKYKKPNPAPLVHVLSGLKIEANAALMIGDSRNDIVAARACGVKSLAVTYGYNHGVPIESCQPDYLVDSLLELG